MESFQSGGESNATFQLSKEHLARLTQPVDEPERSLWDRIMYGQRRGGHRQRGPPSAPPVGAADGAAAALAAQPLRGVVNGRRTTERIFNREIAPCGDPNEPLLTVRRLVLIFPNGPRELLDCH